LDKHVLPLVASFLIVF